MTQYLTEASLPKIEGSDIFNTLVHTFEWKKITIESEQHVNNDSALQKLTKIVQKDLQVVNEGIEQCGQKFFYVNDEEMKEKIGQYLETWKDNFDIWKKAAENGIPEGQILLGKWCFYVYSDWNLSRDCRSADYDEYETLYQDMSEWNEDDWDIYDRLYDRYEGDFESTMWFRRAAEQGNPEAQYLLGTCCLLGEGTLENTEEAIDWFHKAAEQGYAKAQFRLGEYYHKEQERLFENVYDYADDAIAVMWYRKAAEQGHIEAQNVLEQDWVNIYEKLDDETWQLFRQAIEKEQVDAIEYLISNEMDVNCKNVYGETPLHCAVRKNNIEFVRFLIIIGADVNSKNWNGMTPLHYAVLFRYIEIVKILIAAGADINAKDNTGRVPRLMMREWKKKI